MLRMPNAQIDVCRMVRFKLLFVKSESGSQRIKCGLVRFETGSLGTSGERRNSLDGWLGGTQAALSPTGLFGQFGRRPLCPF
jgi:hypothetical protein